MSTIKIDSSTNTCFFIETPIYLILQFYAATAWAKWQEPTMT